MTLHRPKLRGEGSSLHPQSEWTKQIWEPVSRWAGQVQHRHLCDLWAPNSFKQSAAACFLIKCPSLYLFPWASIITRNTPAISAGLQHVWEKKKKKKNSLLHYFHKRGTKGPCPPCPWEPVLITTMLQLKTRPLWGHSYFHQKVCQFKFTQLSCTLFLSPPVRHTGKRRIFQISECPLCNRDAHPLLC